MTSDDNASISVRSRAAFTSHHLRTAIAAAKRIRTVETENAQSGWGAHCELIMFDANTVVLMSVAALEAYIGEVLFEPDRNFPLSPKGVTSAVTMSMRGKANIIDNLELLCLLSNNPLDRGSPAVQRVEALIKLRNELTHYKPDWTGEPGSKHETLAKRIASYATRSPFVQASEPWFPYAWMSYGSAKWAVESVRDLVTHLANTNGWPSPFTPSPSTPDVNLFALP